jgi:uncharacterized RDD family membrane protein YckC
MASLSERLTTKRAVKLYYASLLIRVLSFSLDYLVLALYLALVVALGVVFNTTAPGLARAVFGSPALGQGIGFLLVTLPVTLYFALLESSAYQATWGKRRMGLRVIGADGKRVSFGRALARVVFKFVPWELSHTLIWQISASPQSPPPAITAGFILVWLLVGANLLSLVLSRNHQTLYDRLAGTYVVRSEQPPARGDTLGSQPPSRSGGTGF